MRCNHLNLIIEGVTVKYNEFEALRNVNLKFEGAGLIQIMGPNGAGKTTLLKAIAGLLRVSRGRILICGIDATNKPALTLGLVSLMPQMNKPPPLTPLTIAEFIETFTRKKEDEESAFQYLERVGLSKRLWGMRLSDLSGGMFQRVLLAGVLSARTPIVLLDEPLASVDPMGRKEIANLLGEESKNRMIIVTSHDPNPLLEYTREIVLLNKFVVDAGDPSVVLARINSKSMYRHWVGDHGCCER